eukprot:jgi/Ulvmu1/11182/UM072_0018.1
MTAMPRVRGAGASFAMKTKTALITAIYMILAAVEIRVIVADGDPNQAAPAPGPAAAGDADGGGGAPQPQSLACPEYQHDDGFIATYDQADAIEYLPPTTLPPGVTLQDLYGNDGLPPGPAEGRDPCLTQPPPPPPLPTQQPGVPSAGTAQEEDAPAPVTPLHNNAASRSGAATAAVAIGLAIMLP